MKSTEDSILPLDGLVVSTVNNISVGRLLAEGEVIATNEQSSDLFGNA